MHDDPVRPASPDADATAFRVIQIGDALREAIRSRRSATEQSVREFVAEAVEAELPALVAALSDLGVAGDPTGPGRPIRLPLHSAHVTALRAAAATVGVPACRLLRAALARSARRRRRRPAAGAGREAAGRPRHASPAGPAITASRRRGAGAEPGPPSPADGVEEG